MDLRNLKEPYLIILIGPPLSGKTTWIKKNFLDKGIDIDIISRDQIVLDVHGSNNYDDAFSSVNQKEVDRKLHQEMTDANKNKRNTIIDMTHMTSKRRSHNLSFFDKSYYKLAIIFPILSDDEYSQRNMKRSGIENKTLPMPIVKRMISQYQPVAKEEGFNKVISL